MSYGANISHGYMKKAVIIVGILSTLFVGQTPAKADSGISHEDLKWLNNVTFGATTETIDKFQRLGKKRYLEDQLGAIDEKQALLTSGLSSFEVEKKSNADLQKRYGELTKKIKKLKAGDELTQLKRELEKSTKQYAEEAAQINVLEAIYSPSQLNELMTWFWINHFSVYGKKGSSIGWFLNDYSEAIRERALGNFGDLVLATLKHPVMLRYLDNASNSRGKINENYARELLELHTLGVNGGYTQKDVQELAKVLTGVGVNFEESSPKISSEKIGRYIRKEGFEFDPSKHEEGGKIILGKEIDAGGFDEIENAIEVIISQKKCAEFISSRIATYFMGRAPSSDLLKKMENKFSESHGRISAVLEVLLLSDEFSEGLGNNLKDPQRFVISSMRFVADGNKAIDPKKPAGWLRELNQGQFLRVTPDGYPIKEGAWSGAGQMASRLYVARMIGRTDFFKKESKKESSIELKESKLYKKTVEPYLSGQTKSILRKAENREERNMVIVASPEFNLR